MQFLCDFRVHHEDMKPEQLWDLWEQEADASIPAVKAGKLQAWKVVGQRRVIAIVDADGHDELDRLIMAGLPMAHVLELAEVTPVRSYEAFAADVKARWKAEQLE